MSDWDNFKARFAQQCIAEEAAASEIKHTPLEAELLEALYGIRRYGLDTLSGRADGGPDDREWQREAVNEMTKRARIAIEKATGAA